MTISIVTLVSLIIIHTVADFVLQTDKMATSKSSQNKWLAIHVGVYSLCMLVYFGPVFAAVNFVLHFVTDWCTSRITSRLWKAGRRHDFFVVIGVDQALHMIALVLTYCWLGGW